MTTSDLEPSQTSFDFASTKTVLQALQALSTNTKQIIRVTLTSTMVVLRCEDDGKVCQGSVRFPRAFFSAFRFSGTPSTFSVHLAALTDAMRVFVALEGVTVTITETTDHLVVETTEGDSDVQVSMYAHITIVNTHVVGDLTDHWVLPATEFTAAPALLREAVDDLEWPQGHIRVTVTAQPLQVSLVGKGTSGELEIVLPPQQLRQSVTHEPSVCHHYPFKFLKAALTGVANAHATMGTWVAMDTNGMLKVMHHLVTCQVGNVASTDGGELADAQLSYAIQPLFDEDVDDVVTM